ncbi:hypothetical protein SNOG_16319 [Parastagonospora nodorum SN15]|uniref:Uncharacterized protein n=1 Tax=Phaeosphaeria nodorum (strain SN15 / ATCC MYA-4574 / FGSC 10173) TaxID=321614 RepID=Q0TVZ5_PHANO|nr:hypothetical protein SNOG_16319 [Parastagonospora nodorum SN15]EAT76305.1 hypothetical protein SNOG_16319 [Parastagonospora nodorum SN15]
MSSKLPLLHLVSRLNIPISLAVTHLSTTNSNICSLSASRDTSALLIHALDSRERLKSLLAPLAPLALPEAEFGYLGCFASIIGLLLRFGKSLFGLDLRTFGKFFGAVRKHTLYLQLNPSVRSFFELY